MRKENRANHQGWLGMAYTKQNMSDFNEGRI